MRRHLVVLLAAGCIRYGTPAVDSDAPADPDAPADDTSCADTACPDGAGPWTPTDVGWAIRLALDETGRPRTSGAEATSLLTVELRGGARSCRVPYAVADRDFALVDRGGPQEVRTFLAEVGRPFGFRVAADRIVDDLVVDEDCASVELRPFDDLATRALALVGGAAPLVLVGLGGEPDPVVFAVTDGEVARPKVGGGVLRLPFDVATADGPRRDLPAFVLRSVRAGDGSPTQDGGGWQLEDADTIWDGEQPAPGELDATVAYGITL